MGIVSSKLLSPSDRGEQIEGVLEYYGQIVNVHSIALGSLLTILRDLAYEMFVSGDDRGYRAHVVREALTEFKNTGRILVYGEVYNV